MQTLAGRRGMQEEGMTESRAADTKSISLDIGKCSGIQLVRGSLLILMTLNKLEGKGDGHVIKKLFNLKADIAFRTDGFHAGEVGAMFMKMNPRQ